MATKKKLPMQHTLPHAMNEKTRLRKIELINSNLPRKWNFWVNTKMTQGCVLLEKSRHPLTEAEERCSQVVERFRSTQEYLHL